MVLTTKALESNYIIKFIVFNDFFYEFGNNYQEPCAFKLYKNVILPIIENHKDFQHVYESKILLESKKKCNRPKIYFCLIIHFDDRPFYKFNKIKKQLYNYFKQDHNYFGCILEIKNNNFNIVETNENVDQNEFNNLALKEAKLIMKDKTFIYFHNQYIILKTKIEIKNLTEDYQNLQKKYYLNALIVE